MASSSQGVTHDAVDFLFGRWKVPRIIATDSEFRLILSAYEGRNRPAFLRGFRDSANNIDRDIFLKLATEQIKCNPYNIINQAIVTAVL
jgi:hypothetical protein